MAIQNTKHPENELVEAVPNSLEYATTQVRLNDLALVVLSTSGH